VIGASRTDAGAHALAQVANFHTKCTFDPEAILAYCYEYLPQDIVVTACEEAEERFHARYLATGKIYRYRICNRRLHDVFLRHTALHVAEELDLARIADTLECLLGTHDFGSFTSLKSKKKSTVRTLFDGRVEEHAGVVDLFFHGDGFLMHMVRILTGTLIEVGRGALIPEHVRELLGTRDRSRAGPTVEAHGLCLMEVRYP
jgi:tRNA pseudouridine38-40 synthase